MVDLKLAFAILISLLSSIYLVESSCSRGCDLALGSYYLWVGTNLSFIAEVTNGDINNIFRYNPRVANQDSLLVGTRINVPFPCDCINGEFLGHMFNYTVRPGDTYDLVANRNYANLTTAAWTERNNINSGSQIPDNGFINVTVNCSCGDSGVSRDYWLFVTYPLRPQDSLSSIAYQTNLSADLLQSYNPDVNFSAGAGLVYIPWTNYVESPRAESPPAESPSAESRPAESRPADVGLIVGVVLVIAFFAMVCIYFIWKFSLCGKCMLLWGKKTERDQNIENFLKNNGSFAPKRYSYSNVKKMTNSFKEKLGQGGYGHVYKGKLCNGNFVAVKILKGSKGNGEDFINEVASISKTSHVNIVNLLGFCFEGHKRALVYEFMPNGSLEKFIYDGSSLTGRQLGWEKLYQIAVGIARGLEYLHRGCNTRILHFDIKPNNILLDEDFCPKIADFGLAKLCPGKESILSTVTARGTFGYIAPEIFFRNFGGVSYKSDVYSYGMMVSEMVGGRKNVDVKVVHTSEIYFPHWIYHQLESNNELGLHGIVNEEENEIARKMIIVSLWCIQTDPITRPSMTRVLEMLEGSLESLQIPPKPYLSSPSRSPDGSQTIDLI